MLIGNLLPTSLCSATLRLRNSRYVKIMKTYRESNGTEPLMLNLDTRWAPEPDWTLWRRNKLVGSAGIRNPNHPVCALVTTETTLPPLGLYAR